MAMDLKSIFLFFGIGLTLYAVVMSFVGMRFKSFPNRPQMIGALLVGIFLVVGTATFGVKLQIHEAEERKAGEVPAGEEASVTPLKIPADLRV